MNNILYRDITGIFLIAGSWAPLLAIQLNKVNAVLATMGMTMAILASAATLLDHGMKIHWKIKQSKKEKQE